MKQSYGVGHIHTYASYTQLINNYLILLCLNQQIFFSLQALTLFNIQFILNK